MVQGRGGTKFEVRQARPGDGKALAQAWLDGVGTYADLEPRQFRTPEEEGLVERFEHDLGEVLGEDEIWLVAELQGLVVGYVKAMIDRPVEDHEWQLMRDLGASVLKVDALVVREQYRQKGAGTALMQSVEDWARRRGATVAFLSTAVR